MKFILMPFLLTFAIALNFQDSLPETIDMYILPVDYIATKGNLGFSKNKLNLATENVANNIFIRHISATNVVDNPIFAHEIGHILLNEGSSAHQPAPNIMCYIVDNNERIRRFSSPQQQQMRTQNSNHPPANPPFILQGGTQ